MTQPATTSRRDRERASRYQRIVDEARSMAEAGGWDRVTTRALAQAIEYSQPVLYGHFPGGKADIMNAVALQGFGELAERLAGLSRSRRGTGRIRAVATGY